MEEYGYTPFLRRICLSSHRMMMMMLWKSMKQGGNKEKKWQQKVIWDINQGHRKDGAPCFLCRTRSDHGVVPAGPRDSWLWAASECHGSLAPQGCSQLGEKLSSPAAQAQPDTLYLLGSCSCCDLPAPVQAPLGQHSFLPAPQKAIPYGEGLKGLGMRWEVVSSSR